MNLPGVTPALLLGNELADALDRSLLISIASLTSLRDAVRAYSIHKRRCGMTMDQVILAAGKILSEAEDERAEGITSSPSRDPELARQLREWCREDYIGIY